MEIKIPFLGDGIEQANVIAVLVSPGEKVELEQTLVELETDKATAPVPATVSGVVSELLIKEGDIVSEGAKVAIIQAESTDIQIAANESNASEQQNVVSQPVAQSTPSQSTAVPTQQVRVEPIESYTYVSQSGVIPPAMPGITALATQIGLDLARVRGTGLSGRITWDDLRAHVNMLQAKAFAPDPVSDNQQEKQSTESKKSSVIVKPLELDKFGSHKREKLSSLRQKISQNLVTCWQTIPHVTQQHSIDITDLMSLRKSYNPKYQALGFKLTVTVFIVKVLADLFESFPHFNACIDEFNQELVFRDYVNLGIAVDTENGLVVPVIKDVKKKSLLDICKDLEVLAQKARDRKLSLDNIQGAGFTVSNLGGLGVGGFSPIVNAPEVAILGVGKGEFVPKYQDKEFVPRLMMPVSLSYDHRVIDGADGARFVTALQSALENFDEALIKEGL